jgi:hypothetical protein
VAEIELDVVDGKQVDCVQSIYHAGGRLRGFTLLFSDGSLLKVDTKDDGEMILDFVHPES